MRRKGILGVWILAVAGGALAQTVTANPQTFAVSNGVFEDGADLTGTLVIDIANGVVDSGDLFVTGIPDRSPSSFEFYTLNSGGAAVLLGAGDNIWDNIELTHGGFGPVLQLDMLLGNATSLVNYAGGQLCVFNVSNSGGNCDDGTFFSNYNLLDDPALITGTLVPASTPEPATFLLLAGPAVWMIRRQRRH